MKIKAVHREKFMFNMCHIYVAFLGLFHCLLLALLSNNPNVKNFLIVSPTKFNKNCNLSHIIPNLKHDRKNDKTSIIHTCTRFNDAMKTMNDGKK